MINQAYVWSVNAISCHKIYYYDFGCTNSSTVLICIHGTPRNAKDVLCLDETVGKYARIISIDLAGRNASDKLMDYHLYNEEQYIIDINHVINAIQTQSHKALKLILYGHSQGAWVTFKYASKSQHPFSKVIIGDSGPNFPIAYMKKVAAFYCQTSFTINEIDKLRRFFARSVGACSVEYLNSLTDNIMHFDQLQGLYLPLFDTINISKSLNYQAEQAIGDYVDFWSHWDAIDVPILLLHCSKSEVLDESQVQLMMKKSNVQYYVIENFTHLPFYYDEKLCLRICEFLKD